MEPDLEPLKVEQFKTDLLHLPQDYLSTEDKGRWEQLLHRLRSSKEAVTKPLPTLKTRKRSSPMSTVDHSHSQGLPESIRKLIDKDNERPPVNYCDVKNNNIMINI